MNKTRARLPWLQYLLALIVFASVLGLAFIYRDQLQETVLVPLLYLLWLGELALKSFDQRCIWQLALLIALALSISFSRRTRQPDKARRTTRRRRARAGGRIHFWRRQIWVGSSSAYARSYRRSELRRLVIRTLAACEDQPYDEIKRQLRSGELRVPPEVSYVLGLDQFESAADDPPGLMERLQQNLDRIIENFTTTIYLPDPRLEKAADYLESIMEVDNDAGNR